MKYTLLFLLFSGLWLEACNPSSIKSKKNILIVFAGDSNSGGNAWNSDAKAEELLEKPRLQIWRNQDNSGFEPYQTSRNSIIGHAGLSDKEYHGQRHGWDLNLANEVNAGLFGNRQLFLVKAGQGGSRVTNWTNDEPACIKPWSILKHRLHAAIGAGWFVFPRGPKHRWWRGHLSVGSGF